MACPGPLMALIGALRVGQVGGPPGMHVYQPGLPYVALGKANGRWLARDERTLLRKDVELAVEGAERIDPEQQLVHLARGGALPYDYLVLAIGSRTVPEEI